MNLASVATDHLNRWLVQPPSEVQHHGGACCAIAKQWFHGMARANDFSIADNLSHQGPAWLHLKFNWGANRWPAYWCDLMQSRTFDCGVFAALSREIFRLKGMTAHPGQIIQYFGAQATSHWSAAWHNKTQAFGWIGDGFVYHEVAIVENSDGSCRIYDPTDGFWMNPALNRGHGRAVAMKSSAPVLLTWGPYQLPPDTWLEIPEDVA